MSGPIHLRVALFRESVGWLAQGLEHDIGVQAANLKELMFRLALALDLAAADDSLDMLPPAPPYFQALWPSRAGSFVPDDFAGLLETFDGCVEFAMAA